MEITGKDIRGIQVELIKDYLRRLDKKYGYGLPPRHYLLSSLM
jgi:hypothetical protein